MCRYHDYEPIELDIQIDWREDGKTLKLALETGIEEGYIASEQSYAIAERTPDGREQPMQRWVAAVGREKTVAVMTDAPTGYDSVGTRRLRVTLLRGVHYADHKNPKGRHGDENLIEAGPRFRTLYFAAREDEDYAGWLPRTAQETGILAEYVVDSGHPGSAPRSARGVEISPSCVVIGGIYPDGEKTRIRIFNASGTGTDAEIYGSDGSRLYQGTLAGRELAMISLEETGCFRRY